MLEIIESTGNQRVKTIRSLHQADERRRRGEYLVEGVRLVDEALNAGVEPTLFLVTPSLLERTDRGRRLLERVRSNAVLVTERVLAHAADTVNPQGILAIVPIPREALPRKGFVLVLDRVHDPGNAGTILRAADASGLVNAVIGVESVDLFSPKVVRAAMGAHFHLAISRLSWPGVLEWRGERHFVLADVAGGTRVWDTDWKRADGLIVSSEATGPGPEARALAGETTVIPMRRTADSLNVAAAASIILFEAARQRGVFTESGSRPGLGDAKPS